MLIFYNIIKKIYNKIKKYIKKINKNVIKLRIINMPIKMFL